MKKFLALLLIITTVFSTSCLFSGCSIRNKGPETNVKKIFAQQE